MKCITIDRIRNKQRSEIATREETLRYRILAATLMYMGSRALLQAAFEASNMQQKLLRLRVQHLVEAVTMVKELLSLQPYVT